MQYFSCETTQKKAGAEEEDEDQEEVTRVLSDAEKRFVKLGWILRHYKLIRESDGPKKKLFASGPAKKAAFEHLSRAAFLLEQFFDHLNDYHDKYPDMEMSWNEDKMTAGERWTLINTLLDGTADAEVYFYCAVVDDS